MRHLNNHIIMLIVHFISWQEKLPLVETDEESTWLFHEIGRCYLELKEHEEAKVYGEKSLAAAENAQDDQWQMNASVLIAQAQGKPYCKWRCFRDTRCLTVQLNDLDGAVETFELSLKLASLVGDEQAQDAIKKALKDVVNSKIVEGLKADDNPDNAEGNQDGGNGEQPQAAEDDGEKQEDTGDDEGKKETTEEDEKPTEQEQVDA